MLLTTLCTISNGDLVAICDSGTLLTEMTVVEAAEPGRSSAPEPLLGLPPAATVVVGRVFWAAALFVETRAVFALPASTEVMVLLLQVWPLTTVVTAEYTLEDSTAATGLSRSRWLRATAGD